MIAGTSSVLERSWVDLERTLSDRERTLSDRERTLGLGEVCRSKVEGTWADLVWKLRTW